ncbi:MAG: aminoglycoside phosphotransferase family protein [Burkholderiales bacterium]
MQGTVLLERLTEAENWLREVFDARALDIVPASEDASFRRYFRVSVQGRSWILMDAPPQHEDCRPYVHVAGLLADAGVNAPRIVHSDLDRGFLLLTDLGGTTYLDVLNPQTADTLYGDAVDALIRFQLASRPGELPDYDSELLEREMRLFPEWYIARHRGITLDPGQVELLETLFGVINRNVLAQARVFVHRDYHSRNLMVTSPNPGVLDFQDAVYGPTSYDPVSLFKDAYITWDEERVLDWVIRYWEKARRHKLPVAGDFTQFYRDFEWMGIQRHLKVLGIFARLCYRDGKRVYLDDMPVVMNYLRAACQRYREFHPLLKLLDFVDSADQPRIGYSF